MQIFTMIYDDVYEFINTGADDSIFFRVETLNFQRVFNKPLN